MKRIQTLLGRRRFLTGSLASASVLAATGAEPIVPKNPGMAEAQVFTILDACRKKKTLGKRVVIIGAGGLDTETAICKPSAALILLRSRSEICGWIAPPSQEKCL